MVSDRACRPHFMDAGELVQVRGDPRRDAEDPRPVEGHEHRVDQLCRLPRSGRSLPGRPVSGRGDPATPYRVQAEQALAYSATLTDAEKVIAE